MTANYCTRNITESSCEVMSNEVDFNVKPSSKVDATHVSSTVTPITSNVTLLSAAPRTNFDTEHKPSLQYPDPVQLSLRCQRRWLYRDHDFTLRRDTGRRCGCSDPGGSSTGATTMFRLTCSCLSSRRGCPSPTMSGLPVVLSFVVAFAHLPMLVLARTPACSSQPRRFAMSFMRRQNACPSGVRQSGRGLRCLSEQGHHNTTQKHPSK